ncbi:MAG TPA: hypothetical protein VF763_00995 [Candidatus Limnocylindrales bacterium]
MRSPSIPHWRLALLGGAVVVLAALGVGLVSAAPWSGASTPNGPAVGDGGGAQGVVDQLAGQAAGDQALPARLVRHLLARDLVHAVATFDRPRTGLVTVQLDHGTIGAVGSGTLTVTEAGGASVTVRTDTETRVRIDRQRAQLGDLKVGQQVYVASLVQSGEAEGLARLVVVPPATAKSANPAASPSTAVPTQGQ